MNKVAYVKSQGQVAKHHCHWPGCETQCPPAMWGCRKHWFMLPPILRSKVWASYVPAQRIVTCDACLRVIGNNNGFTKAKLSLDSVVVNHNTGEITADVTTYYDLCDECNLLISAAITSTVAAISKPEGACSSETTRVTPVKKP